MTTEAAGGQAIFEWKCIFFQLFLTIKVKLVNKMMQRAYLCVIFHVKHKKITIYRDFNLISDSW